MLCEYTLEVGILGDHFTLLLLQIVDVFCGQLKNGSLKNTEQIMEF